MKKILIPILSFVALLVILGIILWFNIPNIAARKLSDIFGVPVSMEDVSLTTRNLNIKNLVMANPKNSKTNIAFKTSKIDLSSSFTKITSDVLTIDNINFDNIFIGIEFYNKNGSDNNWSQIMKYTKKNNKTAQKSRKYLIKQLTLTNISVALIKEDGTRQTFPTIARLDFYNISDESGFPISQLEKAIAQEILKSVFQRFSLETLMKTISPQNILEKTLPFQLFK